MNTQQSKALHHAHTIQMHGWVDAAAGKLRRLHEENEKLKASNAELLEALKKRAEVDFAYVQLAVTDMDGDTHERLLEEIDEAENAAKALSSAAIAKAQEGL